MVVMRYGFFKGDGCLRHGPLQLHGPLFELIPLALDHQRDR